MPILNNNTCCPSGYTFIGGGLCCPDIKPNCATIDSVPAIPCNIPQCCPVGYTMIGPGGIFFNHLTGTYSIIGNIPMTPFIGKCVQVVNLGARNPWAILPPREIDAIDCPCCPPGYNYDNLSGDCQGATPKDIVPVVPCIDCLCPDPPPPPDCPTCQEGSGIHISFAINPFVKKCVDCDPQNFQLTNDPKLNCFMPYFLILPNTNNFNIES